MIKTYNNGLDFLNENKSFLDLNQYMAVFFYLDSEFLKEVDKANYALKVENEGKRLLAMKVEPYNLMLYGDSACLNELLTYLNSNNYDIKGVLCPTEIGDELLKISKDIVNKEFYLDIGMDFMEASSVTNPSTSEVETPKESDLDELFELVKNMISDCGLHDEVKKERLISRIPTFRVIRKDGLIVSMASFSKSTPNSCRITHVYTRPKYRGMGYARKVVNNIKNEILESKMIATLNVDQKNPVSNHIYEGLGFKKVFSQGVYGIK